LRLSINLSVALFPEKPQREACQPRKSVNFLVGREIRFPSPDTPSIFPHCTEVDMARTPGARGKRDMSETDATNIEGEALEEGAWSLPDLDRVAESDIMQFMERALPRLSIEHLTRIGETVRQIRQTKQEEARQTTRQAIEARLQATGLSLRDLFPELLPGRRGGEAGSLPPKYRGPNGEEWSGRGHTPRWLTALEATGRQRDEFLIREETRQERTISAATIEDI
jgi:DNA-binding protein H-NS